MKITQEFIDKLVVIEYIENSNSYGHYPFQMYYTDLKGNATLSALALGGDVASCYRQVRKQIEEGINTLFLSLDFPAVGDIEHDFVAVFSIIDNKLSLLAIPYNTFTGETYEQNHNAVFLDELKNQFLSTTKWTPKLAQEEVYVHEDVNPFKR